MGMRWKIVESSLKTLPVRLRAYALERSIDRSRAMLSAYASAAFIAFEPTPNLTVNLSASGTTGSRSGQESSENGEYDACKRS